MKKLLLGAVSAAALLLTANAASANCEDGEMVIKFSHVVAATGHPKGDAATLLAERVNSEMNGKACMEVFANSTLFDDDKVLEALLLGDVQLAAPSLSTVMEDVVYTGLGYWSSGLKQFSANKPLLTPADADGLKFRVQTSDVAVAMIEAMGGSAQKLAFKEVYGALQTGVVEGRRD